MMVKPGSCAMNLRVRGYFTLIRPPPRCHPRRGDRTRNTFETVPFGPSSTVSKAPLFTEQLMSASVRPSRNSPARWDVSPRIARICRQASRSGLAPNARPHFLVALNPDHPQPPVLGRLVGCLVPPGGFAVRRVSWGGGGAGRAGPRAPPAARRPCVGRGWRGCAPRSTSRADRRGPPGLAGA